MTRVFFEEGRPSSTTIPSVQTPSDFNLLTIHRPISSLPTTPHSFTFPPRERILPVTFPAPPSIKLSLWTSTIGTGASGEIRSTLPHLTQLSSPSHDQYIIKAFPLILFNLTKPQ